MYLKILTKEPKKQQQQKRKIETINTKAKKNIKDVDVGPQKRQNGHAPRETVRGSNGLKDSVRRESWGVITDPKDTSTHGRDIGDHCAPRKLRLMEKVLERHH